MTVSAETKERTAKEIPTELASFQADYAHASSAVIMDALRKGYDILQMPEGDIFATGSETVVYHYQWNGKEKKLVRKKFHHSIPEPIE
ncbi:MAG: DUF2671 domain-containing protein [Alphaproteobacteria bacterium]|nr:DUF2671 domain-containing protein [Alphaproteobacteria bacterium]